MAIYVNNYVLKADPDGSIIEKNYAKGLAEIEKLFAKFQVKGNKERNLVIARKIDDKDRVFSMTRKKPKRLPPIALPVELPYYDEEVGATTIRYSTTPPIMNSNGNLSYGTKWIPLNEYMPITDKQKDLAWFLLIVSSLVKKGVYQLVDQNARFEGTFNDMFVQKDVMDMLMNDEELARTIAQKFIDESFGRLEGKELIVRVINWIKEKEKWNLVLDEIKKLRSDKLYSKEKVSDIEWDGKSVTLLECPADIPYPSIVEEARTLGIKITTPRQSKNVLYSLIQHIKNND